MLPQRWKPIKAETRSENLPTNLREAIRLTVFESKTPAKEIAEHLGLSYSQLTNSVNPNLPFKFSSRHIDPLIEISDNSTILQYLASRHGFWLVESLETDEANLTGDDFLAATFGLADGFQDLERAWKRFFKKEVQHRSESLLRFIQICNRFISKLMRLRAIAETLLEKNSDAK